MINKFKSILDIEFKEIYTELNERELGDKIISMIRVNNNLSRFDPIMKIYFEKIYGYKPLPPLNYQDEEPDTQLS